MNIVITGGSGFIGQQVSSQLFDKKDYDVTVLDNRVPVERTSSIAIGDVNNLDNLMNIATLRLKEADTIIHLAGYVDGDVKNYPYQGFTTNVQGTLNVLEVMRRLDIKKIVLASTYLVYEGLVGNVDENSKPDIDKITLYSKTKLVAEWLVKEFAKKYGIQFAILRFGSIYGESERCSNLINDFIRAALENEPITIWGKGENRKPLTYVNDLASGIVAAIKGKNDTFNLASDEHPSVNEVINILKKENPNLKAVFDETKPERQYPIVSAKKAKDVLGWEHKSRFENNLRKIYRLRALERYKFLSRE